MYTVTNYRTKKAMKAAVAEGEQVEVYQPGPFPGTKDGTVSIEGPHSPEPHRWYARVEIANSIITKVIS